MLWVSGVSLQLEGQMILHDINFTVGQNEFVAVIGPNGAGKSSLLRLLHRQYLPHSGTIELKKRLLTEYEATDLARTVAVVWQTPMPLFRLTVEQIAALGNLPHKRWYETDNYSDSDRVLKALTQVGLETKARQYVDTLSGGELQRAHIAKALVQQPGLLLLDEPTNHLDIMYQHQVLSLVKKLKIPAIACLHDINLAAIYCDKILLINKGLQIAFGTPQQVLQQSILEQVFGMQCDISWHAKLNRPQVSFVPSAGSTC